MLSKETALGITERRERERVAVREKILDAARELFVAEGYEAVTMRKIAERIEYSPTAIYFHFRDKEDLMHELCDADFAALAGKFQKISRIADPIDQLRQIGRTYVEFAIEKPNHYRVMFMTPKPPMRAEDSRLKRGNIQEDAYAFLVATVEAAMAAGRFSPEYTDADAVAQMVWSSTHGVVSLHIAKCTDDWVPWKDVRRTAYEVIEVMIRGLAKDAR